MLRNTTSDEVFEVSDDPIAGRAHAIYLERDSGHGSDLDDGLQTEREIAAQSAATPKKRARPAKTR